MPAEGWVAGSKNGTVTHEISTKLLVRAGERYILRAHVDSNLSGRAVTAAVALSQQAEEFTPE